ncbi:D-hexose-6-phosphate mutarotase [Acidithiobacillus montserratensis]|uniref:D-hexose-6-phosphate mutarotase n=1 Tax=Acidithiobacillus montserratensis TaxID=2729135 RepID=A0ACD5HI61_9PROT|nr:D-hexose-6-phosphate mutarotase [Acidithiobacillus montserratensis]MBN2680144.1 D-hexose-6-phosphate mutarotase [Acidithiobacillaceae bacterium]MBU2749013.1 D-hexose-6-phosphate mutarotase [Acidithiobacillus montserratensis]
MQSLDALNRYAIPEHLFFRFGPGGQIFADIRNRSASASVFLQGAHLTAFQPRSQYDPLIWLSEKSRFAVGKSIRGGVPVCWPWFGSHPDNPQFPAHGFARTHLWTVSDSSSSADSTRIILTLEPTEETRTQWPHATPVSLEIVVSETLEMHLTTHNGGNECISLSEALHTYFQIGDIQSVYLEGLDGCEYLDKTIGFTRQLQEGNITFTGETDRIYVNTPSDCVIHDPRMHRRIRISKKQADSTVVWTPWADKATAMGDYTPEGWRQMLCVESANAAENTLQLQPGQTHTLSVRYSAEPL